MGILSLSISISLMLFRFSLRDDELVSSGRPFKMEFYSPNVTGFQQKWLETLNTRTSKAQDFEEWVITEKERESK